MAAQDCQKTGGNVADKEISIASRGFSELTQNWIGSSHGHSIPSLKISCKSVSCFLVILLTKKQTKILIGNNTPYWGWGNNNNNNNTKDNLYCAVIMAEGVRQWRPQTMTTNLMKFIMSPLRRHIFVCFMAKSAFWRGFSALAPYTGVGPK